MAGSAYCWGLNSHNQVVDGRRTQYKDVMSDLKKILPQRVKGVKEVFDISCGGYFTLLQTVDGRVFSFGKGQYGRLGRGSEEDQSEPGVVKIDDRAKEISAGAWHGAIVTDKGELYIWGHGKVMGQKHHLVVPRLIESLARVVIESVSCGNNSTLALDHEGSVYSWGSGAHGVLGHGDVKSRKEPEKIKGLEGKEISYINAGHVHCGAVTKDKKLFMWGLAEGWGRKGTAIELQPTELFVKDDAGDEKEVEMVSCSVGEHHPHTLILTEGGVVYSCGDGYKGKLGVGDQEWRNQPCRVSGLEGAVKVAAGGIHSAALDKEGKVYTWGCGSDGRLGHPDAEGHRWNYDYDSEIWSNNNLFAGIYLEKMFLKL